MDIPLDKMERLRRRVGISFREAKQDLEDTGDEMIDNLKKAVPQEQPRVTGGWVRGRGMTLTRWVTRSQLRVKKGNDTVIKIPAAAGVAVLAGGLLRSEWAIALGAGMAVALWRNYSLELTPSDRH